MSGDAREVFQQERRATGARAAKAARTDIGLSIATHRALILLALATLLLKSLIFSPISWWPLAFICLVPWIVMIGASPFVITLMLMIVLLIIFPDIAMWLPNRAM